MDIHLYDLSKGDKKYETAACGDSMIGQTGTNDAASATCPRCDHKKWRVLKSLTFSRWTEPNA